MKTIQPTNNYVNWLLSVIVAALFLISLVFPGGSVQAASRGVPYIIVFKDTVNPEAEAPRVANAHGLQPGFIYQHALKGMSALVPEGRLEALKHDPRVSQGPSATEVRGGLVAHIVLRRHTRHARSVAKSNRPDVGAIS